MTPDERAKAVWDELCRTGGKLFHDTDWMNPEDIEAVTGPIADAIRAAEEQQKERLARAWGISEGERLAHGVTGMMLAGAARPEVRAAVEKVLEDVRREERSRERAACLEAMESVAQPLREHPLYDLGLRDCAAAVRARGGDSRGCEAGHDKCFANNLVLTSMPPRVPWVCRRCKDRGSDATGGYDTRDEYAELTREGR